MNEKRKAHESIIARSEDSRANSKEYQSAWEQEYEEQERLRERVEDAKAKRLLNGDD